MTWIYFVVTCLISVVVAQNEEITLPANITLPPDLQQQFESPEVKEVQTKYMEEFRKKCDKNGHPEVYENIKTAFQTFMSCGSALVDKDVLEAEIEEAKPDGKVDEVFKKYCDRTPQFKACFRNMTETIKPCFSAAEQKNFKTMYNVTDQLTEFICYKDGDRIALFIAEGGKECFEDKQEALQACFNQTFDSQTQGNLKNMTMDGVFDLEFKEEECNKMTKFQTCVVSVLETCNKPTSANIVDSLFNFVRGATPCKDFSKAEKRNKPNSASSFAVTTGTVLMALTAAMLV